MKKIIASIIIITSLNINAQQKNLGGNEITKVTYKSSLYQEDVKENLKDLKNKITQYRESFEFNLYFDKDKSIFKLVDNIGADDQTIEYHITRMISNELFYKDLVKKEKIKQTTSMDELFNVINPFDEYNWVVTNETKVIDGYTCYKASCQYEEYDGNRKKQLVFNPFVWFAPSLPYPFGPSGLDGLPGLVLEGSFNGTVYFYATKIEFDDKALTKIQRPIHGKYVTREEFDKIIVENYQKMNDMR
ncbi:MAG: GLPGLI family protein [Flavobacterium sp. JAD_PAG50586_2]|nr:MAG: GLPGLI family protein [Flavobacterium sp. JAD_PAG50586_2]